MLTRAKNVEIAFAESCDEMIDQVMNRFIELQNLAE